MKIPSRFSKDPLLHRCRFFWLIFRGIPVWIEGCIDWLVALGCSLSAVHYLTPPPLEDPKAAMNTKDGTPVKNSPAAKGPPTTPLAVNNAAGAAAAALAQGSPAVNSLERELLERQGPGPLMDRPISATEKATANANEQRDKMDAFAKRSAAKRRQRQSSNSQLNVAKQHQEMEVLPLLKGRQKSSNEILLLVFFRVFSFENFSISCGVFSNLDTAPNEQEELLVKKLSICSCLFDFMDVTADVKNKEMKR